MWPAPETFTQNDTLPNRVQDVFFHFTALTGLFVGVTNQWEDTDASKIIPHYNFSAREPIDPCHICDQSASTWQLLNLLFIVWEILRVLVSFQIRLTQRRILNSTCVSLTGCWIAHLTPRRPGLDSGTFVILKCRDIYLSLGSILCK